MRSQGIAALLAALSALAAAPARSVSTPSQARALGIPAGGDHRHIRVRTSLGGQTWSEWLETTTDPESGTLVWIDTPFRYAEIQGLQDSDRVLLIDPGITPRHATEPGIQGRAAWCPAPFVCPKGSAPTSTRPTHLIVHHTASANTATDFPALLRSFWELHVKGNGWADIGYNFLIDPAGTAWEGRGDGILGAHFSGVNTATAGISLIGTYTGVAPSAPALATLVELLTWQAAKYSLDPLGVTLHAASGLELNVISGHRDAGLSPRASGRTECPGIALYPILPEIRESVCQATNGCEPLRQRPNSCATATTPCLSRYGVVNTANFDSRPVAAGSIAAAFGANLEGLTARVNGRPATVFGGNANQLNFLVPANTEPGASRLELMDGATVKAESLIAVTELAPAIYAAVNADDQTLNTPATPVGVGRPLTLYLAGAAPSQPWSATLGGSDAEKLYLGPAPGFPGLWQANIGTPLFLTPGTTAPIALNLVLTISGVPSRPFPVTVKGLSGIPTPASSPAGIRARTTTKALTAHRSGPSPQPGPQTRVPLKSAPAHPIVTAYPAPQRAITSALAAHRSGHGPLPGPQTRVSPAYAPSFGLRHPIITACTAPAGANETPTQATPDCYHFLFSAGIGIVPLDGNRAPVAASQFYFSYRHRYLNHGIS